MRGGASLKGKGGLVDFRRTLKVKGGLVGFRKKTPSAARFVNKGRTGR